MSTNWQANPTTNTVAELMAKIQPPDGLRSVIAPLTGLCTYKLIDDLRFDMHKIPPGGSLCEEGDDAACKNMGEQLLSLDKVIRIPTEASEIQDIYRIAREVVQYWLMEKCAIKSTDENLKGIGSFVSCAKIKDVDEFDFLFIARVGHQGRNYIIDRLLTYPMRLTTGERYLLLENTVSIPCEPCLIGFYNHGPAYCTELAWACDSGHGHFLSIDLTIAGNLTLDSFPSMTYTHDTPIFADIVASLPGHLMQLFTVKGRTTAAVDEHVIRKLTELSPNILSAYRLMKCFCSILLPYTATSLRDKFDMIELSGVISSHQLKQVVYRCVGRNPDREKWSVSELPSRLVDMIEDILSGGAEEDYLVTRPTSIKSISLSPGKQKRFVNNMYKESYQGKLKKFQSLLKTNVIIDLQEIANNAGDKLIVLSKDGHHSLDSSDLRKLKTISCIGTDLVYKFYHDNSNAASTHPLITWCNQAIRPAEVVSDLSSLPDHGFEEKWLFYKSGLAKDITNIDRCLALNYNEINLFLKCNISDMMSGFKLCTLYDYLHISYSDEYKDALTPFLKLMKDVLKQPSEVLKLMKVIAASSKESFLLLSQKQQELIELADYIYVSIFRLVPAKVFDLWFDLANYTLRPLITWGLVYGWLTSNAGSTFPIGSLYVEPVPHIPTFRVELIERDINSLLRCGLYIREMSICLSSYTGKAMMYGSWQAELSFISRLQQNMLRIIKLVLELPYTSQSVYGILKSRAEAMEKGDFKITGVEIIVLAYMWETPIHIYYPVRHSGHLEIRFARRVLSKRYPQSVPLRVLYTEHDHGAVGRFDLLRRNGEMVQDVGHGSEHWTTYSKAKASDTTVVTMSHYIPINLDKMFGTLTCLQKSLQDNEQFIKKTFH